MNRTDARERVMYILYRTDVLNETDRSVIQGWIEDENFDKQQAYAENIIYSCLDNVAAIDECIDKFSDTWNTKRMAKTDLAILRLAVCEILYWDDVPDPVAANEAVDLAKKYGTDDAPVFINGILGSLIRSKAG